MRFWWSLCRTSLLLANKRANSSSPGTHGTSVATTWTKENQHRMQYLEELVRTDGSIALDAGKVSPPQLQTLLSHGLPSLYLCAYRLLGNEADAEDAVQDALLSAFRHLNQFRGGAQFSTWLTAIVISCARMHLRKRSRYTHVSLIHEARKSRSIVSPSFWWTSAPIPRTSAMGLCCIGD